MRSLPAGIFVLVVLATPAFALSAGDTMQAWAGASSTDKDALLHTLDMAGSGHAAVRSCLDDTAKAAGHANLPISEVAKACAEQAARDNI